MQEGLNVLILIALGEILPHLHFDGCHKRYDFMLHSEVLFQFLDDGYDLSTGGILFTWHTQGGCIEDCQTPRPYGRVSLVIAFRNCGSKAAAWIAGN